MCMRTYRSNLSLISGIISAVLGAVTIVFWLLQLAGWLPKIPLFLSLNFFTGVGFLLAGLSIIFLNIQNRIISYLLSFLLVLLGLFNLMLIYFRYLFSMDPEILRMSFLQKWFQLDIFPLDAAACFVLVGVVLLSVIPVEKIKKVRTSVVFFSSLIIGFNTFKLLTYFSASSITDTFKHLFRLGQLDWLSLQSELGFMIIGFSLIMLVFKGSKIPRRKELIHEDPLWLKNLNRYPWVQSAVLYFFISMTLAASIFFMDIAISKEVSLNKKVIQLNQTVNDLISAVRQPSEYAEDYVQNNNEESVNQYWNYINTIQQREKIINEIIRLGLRKEEVQYLVVTKKRSDQMVQLEARAMRLMAEARGIPQELMHPQLVTFILTQKDRGLLIDKKRELAESLLFDREYFNKKEYLVRPAKELQELLNIRIQNEIEGTKQQTSFWLFVLMVLAVFIPILLTIDISKRKRVEEALKESIERFELAAHGANDGLWDGIVFPPILWSSMKTYVWYSPRFRELLGYEKEEFPNLLGSWFSIVHPEDQAHVMKSLQDHVDRKVPYDIEYRLLTKMRGYRWFQARGQGIWDKKGVFKRIAGSLRDVTDRRLAQGKLKESNEDLVRNERRLLEALSELRKAHLDLKSAQNQIVHNERFATIGKLAGMISHEFRNELGVMRNAAFFLKMKFSKGDPKIKKHLDILEERIQETDRIIENIMTFAKTKKPVLKSLDLKELILASIGKIKIPDTIQVHTEIDEHLPKVKADDIHLSRIFINIIINAIQAMAGNGDLWIRAKTFKHFVHLTFEDNGIGIKDEDKERIFEPLFTTKARGAGFGLSAVRLLIEAQGGTIDVESQVGKGTLFIIELPR